MALSLLQAKNLLMMSAFRPSTPLPWLTGSRVNPGLALHQAASALGTGEGSVTALGRMPGGGSINTDALNE